MNKNGLESMVLTWVTKAVTSGKVNMKPGFEKSHVSSLDFEHVKM